jgi:hypothetical protein
MDKSDRQNRTGKLSDVVCATMQYNRYQRPHLKLKNTIDALEQTRNSRIHLISDIIVVSSLHHPPPAAAAASNSPVHPSTSSNFLATFHTLVVPTAKTQARLQPL